MHPAFPVIAGPRAPKLATHASWCSRTRDAVAREVASREHFEMGAPAIGSTSMPVRWSNRLRRMIKLIRNGGVPNRQVVFLFNEACP